MDFKLGKLPPKHNDRTLSLQAYLHTKAKLPARPNKLWREFKVPEWGMYGNDMMGDCTVAAKAHTIMLMTAHTGKMVTPDPDAIVQAYIDLTGYDPVSGANDTGCAMTDVLQYWQQKGIAGHKILGWAQIDHTNIEQVKLAMYLFGVVDIGVQFPQSGMDQFDAGEAFHVVDSPIAGGHDIPLFGYGARGAKCVTWSKDWPLDWDWFMTYCDEAYCPISPDWIDSTTGVAPNLLNVEALDADLKALAV